MLCKNRAFQGYAIAPFLRYALELACASPSNPCHELKGGQTLFHTSTIVSLIYALF
ncbi:MAG: hypothetical protein PUJ82_05715 [Spirochaetales bacterium]|nr:hypothetical protein [Spirochaetales bacterium]